MASIGSKIASGAAWMVFAKFASKLLGLVSTVILARLLLPSEFGVVAMAMSVIGVLELMRNFSFDVMLIQKQDASHADYNTAWTCNVLLGLLVALVLWFLASPMARFYGEPDLSVVIKVLAFGTALQGFENIGIVDFRKRMHFRREFGFMMLPRLAGFIVSIPLAFILRNYWALVAGMLAIKVTSVSASYIMSKYRPWFSLESLRELFGFSLWLFLLNIFQFAWVRSADFIIGRIEGARMLGIFSISYQLSNLPTTELVAPINRAVFPGYALVTGDRELLRQGYIAVLSVVSILSLPAGAGVAAIAPVLVDVVLGPKWVDAAPVIAILALFGVVSALLGNTGSIFKAIGRPQVLTMLAGARMIILIPVLVFAVKQFGLLGAAFSYLAVALVFMPIIFYLLCLALDLPARFILEAVWRPAVATTVMYFSVDEFVTSFYSVQPAVGSILVLITSVLIGFVVYISVLALAWVLAGRPNGGERAIVDRVPFLRSLTWLI